MTPTRTPVLRLPARKNLSQQLLDQAPNRPEPSGSHKRPRREASPSSSSNGEDGDDGGNYIQESGKDSTHPNRLGPSIDPEIDQLDQLFHSNQSGLMPSATSSTAPAMTTKDDPLVDLLRKLRIQTKLDDKHYQDAITILNTPGAAMPFLVFQEMQRLQQDSSGSATHEPKVTANNNNSTAEPPSKGFQYSNVLKDRIRDISKETMLRSDIQAYTQKRYTPGTGDRSLLTLTMQSLHGLPLEFRRKEFPPGVIDGDNAATKDFISQVRKIQRHVRYGVREKLLSNIVRPDNSGFVEEGEVPNIHELAETVYRHLHPVEASVSNEQLRNISVLFIARVAHLRLQTVNHLVNPPLKKISQWDLVDQKLKELATCNADYCAVWGKAVLAKDHALFGQGKTFAQIAKENTIEMPTDDEVQEQLNILLRSRAGRTSNEAQEQPDEHHRSRSGGI